MPHSDNNTMPHLDNNTMPHVDIFSLKKSIRDLLIEGISQELSTVAINQRTEVREPPRTSIEIIPAYISAATALVNEQVGKFNLDSGFTSSNSIEFYLNVLNAIDNMILLDYIRDNLISTTQTSNISNYTVAKTNNIDADIALLYYSVSYPNDTTVDAKKLNDINSLLSQFSL